MRILSAITDAIKHKENYANSDAQIAIDQFEDIGRSLRCFVLSEDAQVKFMSIASDVGSRLALPFKAVSFEFLSPIEMDKQPRSATKRPMKKPLFCGITIHEVSPEEFFIISLFSDAYNMDGTIWNHKSDIRSISTRHITETKTIPMTLDKLVVEFRVVGKMINLLNDRDTRLAKSLRPQIFTPKHGSDIVKPIVFIGSRCESRKVSSIKGIRVDWKHTWEVMGHWRKAKTIGKDRDGIYCVAGYTWIVPHERGDGPLIKKMRFLKSKEQEQHP